MENELKTVIYKGKCLNLNCDSIQEITVNDVLYQKNVADDDFHDALKCNKCDIYYYVTNMCIGKIKLGKKNSFKHCNKCLIYGKCIDNPSLEHC